MPKSHFSLVADDLLHVAERAYSYLQSQGYRVAVEKRDLDHPRVPSLVAKMGHSTLIVEVAPKVSHDVAREWVGYAQSCDSDTQFAFALPVPPPIPANDIRFAVAQRIGVLSFEVTGETFELASPCDLAMRVTLPPLTTFNGKVRRALAPAYQKWHRGDWRGGFVSACQVLELMSAKYLKSRVNKPGVAIVGRGGKVAKPTNHQIDKAPIGALTEMFEGITTPNSLDSLLARTLKAINKERVGAVHKSNSASVEIRLRAKTGKRMYAIINCVKELVDQ